ncbi:ParB/RepB/Spo0J family partition protein [Geomonas sp. Red32]|uniref:ParB/RepB/Spo0J family partition protein n=1 Tax=Geomonas sp. Red32 TaxID=2912856 RepID=UPI00202CFAB5|nr:ParB/RepB/Spo0J family partition protein [Geomonas sp. Red32]MCM0080488.1 ParB/RepB/Spo0J family partition protein [Geomonas sp. Red32]
MSGRAPRYRMQRLYQVPLANLKPDPQQPRKYFDPVALADLGRSITTHGILQPILACKAGDGGLTVVSGERRYQAALQAGLTEVPVIVTAGNAVEIALVENLLREDLTAIEEAEAIERLKGEHSYTLADLSGILGKAESTLSEILSLNRLPETVKNDCRNDPKVARGILQEIVKAGTAGRMSALYQKYKERGLTRGEIRIRKRAIKQKEAQDEPTFVALFLQRLEALDLDQLAQAEVVRMFGELSRLRQAAQTKLNLLKKKLPAGENGG